VTSKLLAAFSWLNVINICEFCNLVSFILIFSTIMLSLMIRFRVCSNAKKPSCFYPIPQAADCILRVVERADAPIVYLSTDAAESETGLLQSLVVLNGRPVPLVTRPARNSAEKWDALLYRHGLDGDTQVRWQRFILLYVLLSRSPALLVTSIYPNWSCCFFFFLEKSLFFCPLDVLSKIPWQPLICRRCNYSHSIIQSCQPFAFRKK